MNDALLPLEPGDEVPRLRLASAIRDETLAELERAIALERAKKAALLEAAKDALEVHEWMHGKSTMAGDLYVSQVLRNSIAEVEEGVS